MTNTVLVEIAGREYQLRTDEDPEYVAELANFVTVKVLEIKRDSNASALDCATMAALDIADRYFKEQKKKTPTRKKAAAAAPPPEPPTLL
ncbi:MAG: cell division protein ZapA [Clostridiales bacterium]|nr:cell division protein ZapA [Clostridiales bacterium]